MTPTLELPSRFAAVLNPPNFQLFQLQADGFIPNSRLALVIYCAAVKLPGKNPAKLFEEIFAANHWRHSWRNGIYPFHHYHSITHEVLGIYSGAARVQFGGEQGISENVSSGDVVIIPAGLAHKSLTASSDLGVVGAYPDGHDWDLQHGRPDEHPGVDENIRRVALPKTDPIYGPDGPLLELWNT